MSQNTKYAAFAIVTTLCGFGALCAVEALATPQKFAQEFHDPANAIYAVIVYFWLVGSEFYKHRPRGVEDPRISQFFPAIANYAAVLLVFALEYGVYSTTHNRALEALSAAAVALLVFVIERTLGGLLLPPQFGDATKLRTSLWFLAACIALFSALYSYGGGSWYHASGKAGQDNANFAFALWACAVWWLGARFVVIYGRMRAAYAAEA